jgi:hypothetical protein
MIRGYFIREGGQSRPFVDAVFGFPGPFAGTFQVRLLADTGADRTVIGPRDASRLSRRLGIDLATLPSGVPSRGIGGQQNTRTIQSTLAIGSFATTLTLTILDPGSFPLLAIPSLLGRDVSSRFALIVEQRTNRVLLLEPHEADALNLP